MNAISAGTTSNILRKDPKRLLPLSLKNGMLLWEDNLGSVIGGQGAISHDCLRGSQHSEKAYSTSRVLQEGAASGGLQVYIER